MSKFKIGIQVIETFNNYVIVDADNMQEAKEKVEKVWNQEVDYLYDKTTECCDNQEVNFFEYGEASKSDINMFDNLDRYDYE